MKFSLVALVAALASSVSQDCHAFSVSPRSTLLTTQHQQLSSTSAVMLDASVAADDETVAATIDETTATTSDVEEEEKVVEIINHNMEWKEISNLPYRQLQHQLKIRELDALGTTAVLRERLHMACGGECIVDERVGNCDEEQQTQMMKGVEFTDNSDPDFDRNELIAEIMSKAEVNHWKAATRKLKKLKKNYPAPIPEDVYRATLQACMSNRLNGARASEPARKIMEDMADNGLHISKEIGNYCLLNSLGEGPNGTHDGCGGIDTALAMMAAVESVGTPVEEETYARIATVMSRAGDVDDSLALLRVMITEKSCTPTLGVFADMAMAALAQQKKSKDMEENIEVAQQVTNVLALCKAAGYELDSIASTVDGRTLLAAGVIASERMDNCGLGLRLLTAAAQAKGCDPDRGDGLVASSSSQAQRAATLIHKRAINRAVESENWKLAVKLLELMMERSLTPSPAVWRNVVTCCAKNSKSRKATALLLDWMRLAEAGKTEKPPLRVFNTVVNVCEVCEEQELTLLVLEAMKKTHQVDGNIVTFNIALKRLAKQGSVEACEGIIIGMLQQGVEPSVVSYTTAIAACALEGQKNPTVAYEWIKRMRSRNVMPNVISYNTALAACLDGKLESSMVASKLASEMLQDVEKQLEDGSAKNAYTSVIPDSYTKSLARQVMKQLRDNWRSGDIDIRVAKATVRVPLLHLVDFNKSDQAGQAEALKEEAAKVIAEVEDEIVAVESQEIELEYATAASMHRRAEV